MIKKKDGNHLKQFYLIFKFINFLSFFKTKKRSKICFHLYIEKQKQQQNTRKQETVHKNSSKERCEQSEDEFIEVELESDEEHGKQQQTKERKDHNSYRNSFPLSSDSDSEKFQKVIDSKKFSNHQSTLNLFRNLASGIPTGRSTITAFSPYALNCQLNNALQYADQ